MPLRVDQAPKGPGWIGAEIRKLWRAIDQLRGAPRLQNASIVGGRLLVTDSGHFAVIASNGSVILDVGNLAAGGTTTQMGMLIGRVEDGSTVLATYNYLGTAGTAQTLNWFDHGGNILVQDDQAGVGLGRPYLGTGGWYDATSAQKTPLTPCTAHTWTTVQECPIIVQHPRIRVYVLGMAAASTTGQLRLTDPNGNQIGSTISFSNGGYGVAAIEGALTNPPIGAEMYLSLQAQVTTASGTISAAGLSTWGLGSQL